MAATFLLFMVGACGELKSTPTDPGPSDRPDPTASFSRVQAEIFTPTCALSACHDRDTQQQQLVLEPGRAYENIVNRPSTEISTLKRVLPGDADNSFLFLKVTGSPRIVGDRMPQGRTSLSVAQVALLRDWIRRGAPND